MPKSSTSNAGKVAAIVVVLAAVAVAWALSSGDREPDISSYYPLLVGNSWSYQTKQYGNMVGPTGAQEGEKLGKVEQRVLGASRLSSEQLRVFKISQKAEEQAPDGTSLPAVESFLHVSATPSVISLHEIELEGPDSPSMPAPVPILTDPPAIDEVLTTSGSLTIAVSVDSQQIEAVEVPAGKYPKALKRVAGGPVTGAVSDIPVSSGSMKETTWFVRDVGIVKQERVLEMRLEGADGSELRIEERSLRELTRFSPETPK